MEVVDERSSGKAYAAAKRMREICDASETPGEAEAGVLKEFPAFDLSALRAMGFYYHRFNPKGSRHVRQR